MRLGWLVGLMGCASSFLDTSGDGICQDIPPVNYTNFGSGFLTENCQGCHASTASYRYGAPDSVTFDSVEQAWAWRERILDLVVDGEEPAMPPAGGVDEDDLLRLQWWFDCAEEGT